MTTYFAAGLDMRHLDMSCLGKGDLLVFIDTAPGNVATRNILLDESARALSRSIPADILVVAVWTHMPEPKPETGLIGILPDQEIYDGTHLINASPRPQRVWPGAEVNGLHVFHHADWPGTYGAVNLNPIYWEAQPVTIADVVRRSRLLPDPAMFAERTREVLAYSVPEYRLDDPIALTNIPASGMRRSCTICHARCDLRFARGHGWGDGDRILRAGTDEVIVEVARASRLFRDEGAYCATCIEAFEGNRGLRAPEGTVYDPVLNPSVFVGTPLIRGIVDWPRDPDPLVRARWRYGAEAFEWWVLETERGCGERLDRLDLLVRRS